MPNYNLEHHSNLLGYFVKIAETECLGHFYNITSTVKLL